MEGEGSGGGQSRRGGGNSNQLLLHGQVERSSGERTPKKPCHGERSRNYDGMSVNSGKSSRSSRKLNNSSGQRTPVSAPCEQPPLFLPGNVTSGERTPKSETVSQNNERKRGVGAGETCRKREKSGDGVRNHEAVDDSRYGSGSNSVSRRQSFQSTSSYYGPSQQELSPSSGKGGNSRMYAEGKNRKRKEQQIKGHETSTEDSACSIFRGHWNAETNPEVKPDDFPTSEVSAVQRFVQTQSKALDKSGDIDEQEEDGKVHSEFKCKEKVLNKQKAVAAVLAFQRWRHTQLKRHFSLELKKVLEEAKEDEACLARLEQDLATKDRHIAQLRYQLTSYETTSESQMIQRNAIDANIKELQSEMLKALERAATAEDELHKRDCEIRRLRDRMTSLEDEGIRIDSELQSSLTNLHNDKESAINEGRVLLSQLSRRDEEVALQCKEIDKLRATIAHITTRQVNSQREIETLKAEQRDEVNDLQEKLQHALDARHAKEMELVSYTEKCQGLDHERQSLLLQLNRALERTDLASQRAEELQGKLHCTAEKRATASEEIAGEMVEQLKRLTGHMKELESSMDKTALRFPVGVFQNKAVAASLAKLSNKLAQAEATSMDILTHADSFLEPERSGPLPGKVDSKRQVCFSFPDEKNKCCTEADHPPCHNGKECSLRTIDRDTAFTKFKKWIAWKWRWAASAAKAENLSKQLRLTDPILQEGESLQERSRQKQLDVYQPDDLVLADSERLGTSIVKHKLGDLILKHKLVPVMLMAWRAFTRLSNLHKMANARNESLKKIISALPWWIRRVGERRALERYFFHWRLLALRANRVKGQQQQQQNKKLVPLSRPALPSKLRTSPTGPATPLPSPPVKTIYRDAESQTDKFSRLPEADPRSLGQRSKTEPRTAAPPVPKNDIRKKLSADGPRLGVTQETKNRGNTTAAVRQLRGFQNSFHQELKEFQDAVSREIDTVEQIPSQRSHTTYGRLTGTTQVDPAKLALKSVFNVCNNLAQALSEVREQLFGAEHQTQDPQVLSTNGKTKRNSTMYPEIHDDWEGGEGTVSRERDSNRPAPHMHEKVHHYALPIGRVGRFKSPRRQQPGEALVPTSREGWPSSAYVSGATGNRLTRTVRQTYENSADQLQYFQEDNDDMYRSFRQGRAEQQTKGRPFESARGLRQPAREDADGSYDLKNVQVDSNPYGNTGGKHQHPQAGREDSSNQLKSGGLEKSQLLLSDTGRVGGRVARFKTLPDNDDSGLSTSLSRPQSDCLHTTVVQILNHDNNKIGEVAIHTHPLNGGGGSGRAECVSRGADLRSTARVKDESRDNTTIGRGGKLETRHEAGEDRPRPSSAPGRSQDQCRPSVRPTSAPRFHQTSTIGQSNRPNNALDRRPTMNFITSLRRKQCIGADYADLLRAEIIRLRDDRLSLQGKSLHTTFEERKDLPCIRRPGWRNIY